MGKKIRIDVLTLDSVQCAACGYMMESIAALPVDVQQVIEYKEWSIKSKAGIDMFTKLKGKVLPTICIEKDLVFQSMIPQYEELIDALAERAGSDDLRERILALLHAFKEFGKRLVGHFVFKRDPGPFPDQLEILNNNPLRRFVVIDDQVGWPVGNPHPNRVVLLQPGAFLSR